MASLAVGIQVARRHSARVQGARGRTGPDKRGPSMQLAPADYEALSRPHYGSANPQRIDNPLWVHIIRNGWGGYSVRKAYGDRRRAIFRNDATSAYREQENGPVWSWSRFGQTSTALPDGRIVHIAGEHEDFYDPDFCIFNDVVVAYPDGQLEIYGYPKEVFPPTDFHTATLVGDAIILIGSVGYMDMRRHGETQVFRLDIATWCMERVVTSGEGPGWIGRHSGEHDGGDSILVVGGCVERFKSSNGAPADTEYVANDKLFALKLDSFTWQRVPHGDERIFPVDMQAYEAGRSPQLGRDNPERIDNPFWHEMVRRGWRPGRARLHYGNLGPSCPHDDSDAVHAQRPIADVVWTAVRAGAAQITLADGRQLTIGGQFSDFGSEWADRWVYNDIIVRHPDGAVAIYAYPADVLPPLMGPWAMEAGGQVLVFGGVSRYEPGPRRAVAVALDSQTLQATLCDAVTTRPALVTGQGPQRADENTLVFSVVKRTRDEARRYVSFDLKTLKWREG